VARSAGVVPLPNYFNRAALEPPASLALGTPPNLGGEFSQEVR